MDGHCDVEDLPPAVLDDEEDVEDVERERGHSEKVHGRDGLAVIAEKSLPSLDGVWSAGTFGR